MNMPQAPDTTAAHRLASTLRASAHAHERALLVEIWAAERFQRSGDLQAAQRHRDTSHREAALAEGCYRRLAELAATRR